LLVKLLRAGDESRAIADFPLNFHKFAKLAQGVILNNQDQL
jgi:hypothetical protein